MYISIEIEINHQRYHDNGCGDHDENRDDGGDDFDLVQDQRPSIVSVPDAGVAKETFCYEVLDLLLKPVTSVLACNPPSSPPPQSPPPP